MFRKLFFLLIFLFFSFRPGYLLSAQRIITTSIAVREMYDDNIYLWAGVKRDDFVTTIRPSATLDIKMETTDIKGGMSLNILQYADETELNTVEQTYTVGAHFLTSERLSIGLDGRYTRDTTLETELTETGVGLIRSIRQNYSFSPSIMYALSEKDSLSLSPFYMCSNYESPSYSDYWVSGVNLNYERLLKGKRLSLIGQAGYNHIKFKSTRYLIGGRYNNYQLYGGINYLFSETLKMSLLLGIRYTDSKMKSRGYIGPYSFIILYEEKTIGWVADVNLSKTYQRGILMLGARRQILPSGLGDQLETNRLYIHFINNFTERLRGEVDASYYQGKGEVTIGTYHTWHIIPTLRYYLTKDINLELNYSHISYKYGNFHSDRNTILLGMEWNWKYLWH